MRIKKMLEKQRNGVLKDELEKRPKPTLRVALSFLQTPRLSKGISEPVFKSRETIKEEFAKRGITIEEFRDPLISTLEELNFQP